MLKKIAINSLVFGITPHLSKLLSVFLLPIMTKYLSASDYGIYGTLFAYTSALATLQTFGLTILLVSSFYKDSDYKVVWRRIYGMLQIWNILFGLMQVVLIISVIPPEAKINLYLILILNCLPIILFGATSTIGLFYYQLKQDPKPIAIRVFISGSLSILLSYYLVVYKDGGYMGWFWGSFVSNIFLNVSYIPSLYKLDLLPKFSFSKIFIVNSLKVAVPKIPHDYSYYLLGNANRVVLDQVGASMKTIGELSVVQSLVGVIDSFNGAVNQAINPMTMEAMANKRVERMRALIYIYSLIVCFASFVFSIWSKEIFSLLIKNKELSSAYKYSIVLAMAQCYRPLFVAASNVYFINENTKDLLKISFVAGLITLLGYIIFIPYFGLWAAVVFNFIGLFYMGIVGHFFRYYKNNTLFTFPIRKYVYFVLLMLVVAFMLVGASILLKLFITLLFSGLLIFIFYHYIYKNKNDWSI